MLSPRHYYLKSASCAIFTLQKIIKMKTLLKISFPSLLIFAGIIAVLIGSCTRGDTMCACYNINPAVRNHFNMGKSLGYDQVRSKCDSIQIQKGYDTCEILKIK